MYFLLHFLFFIFICFIHSVNPLDMKQLNTSVWLSGAAYCNKENYPTMKLSGPASGFIYMETLYDAKTDLQGYIGIIQETQSIYIVLRGSSSAMNWLADLEIRLVPYDSYPECNCNVHRGFYHSALGVYSTTIDVVKLLLKVNPTYSVILTGHSYGASCGQILAMELERKGIKTQIYNFGQPRVGDDKYAGFVNTIIDAEDYWRVTHDKDIVPHVPPEGLGYLHSCREVFEDDQGVLKICSEADCEDPECANRYKWSETNGEDHSYYLGHEMSCEQSTL